MSAIAFDLDDTLYDLCWPYARAVSDCFSGKYDRLAEALFMRSRVHSDEVFEDWSSGRMRTDDMYAYRNLKSFDDFGIRITREEALRIQDLYKEYQKLISIYNAHPEIRRGEVVPFMYNEVLAFERKLDTDSLLVLVNLRDSAVKIPTPETWTNKEAVDLTSNFVVALRDSMEMAPYSYLILK